MSPLSALRLPPLAALALLAACTDTREPPSAPTLTDRSHSAATGTRHDVVAEDLAPIFESFVAREDGGGVFLAAAHELKEQHRAETADRQVAELIDDEQ